MTERERALAAQVNRLISLVTGLDFFIERFLDHACGQKYIETSEGYGAYQGYEQVWSFSNLEDLDLIRDERGEIIK